jgi:hypothetical protein
MPRAFARSLTLTSEELLCGHELSGVFALTDSMARERRSNEVHTIFNLQIGAAQRLGEAEF